MMANKDVAKKDEGGTALVVADDMLMDMAADSGGGFEGATGDDYAIPFIGILQKTSPQVDKDDDKYIEGAEAGMFINSVSGELMETIRVVPCARSREFAEWGDREAGGGMFGRHHPDSAIVKNARADGMARFHPSNGHELVDTRYHYCLLVKDGGTSESVVLAFSSTGIKVSKNWMTNMRNFMVDGPRGKFNPPMFGQVWTFGPLRRTNNDGSWYVFEPIGEAEIVADADLYARAKQFGVMAKEQSLNLSEEGGGGGATSNDTGSDDDPDDEIPF